jgi:hypothetical protein
MYNSLTIRFWTPLPSRFSARRGAAPFRLNVLVDCGILLLQCSCSRALIILGFDGTMSVVTPDFSHIVKDGAKTHDTRSIQHGGNNSLPCSSLPCFITKQFPKHLISSRRGAVVIVSSYDTKKGDPHSFYCRHECENGASPKFSRSATVAEKTTQVERVSKKSII